MRWQIRSVLLCLGHFSYIIASLLVRFLPRSRYTQRCWYARPTRTTKRRRRRRDSPVAYGCPTIICKWATMKPNAQERKIKYIKKRPTIFWGGESRRRERERERAFSPQPYPKYPRQQPGQREKKKKKRRDFSYIYVRAWERREMSCLFSPKR